MSGAVYLTFTRCLLLAMLALLLAAWLSRPAALQATWPALDETQCQVRGGGHDELRIYQPTDVLAEALASQLCQQTLVGSGYGRVSVSWRPREQLDTDTLLRQQFDLLWDRQRVLEGRLARAEDLYRLLRPMPSYRVAWYSHRRDPALTPAFFADLRIGLLADSQSQSGHQWPMKQLAQHQLPASPAQLHFYTSRQALLADFLAGELDLIPAVSTYPQLKDWPTNQQLTIADDLPIGNWYLSRRVPAALACPLARALDLYRPLVQAVTSTPWAGAECGS
ncbi:hypothetical protein [Pseudaeromonas paramecii]|uniref:Solute-binding protein family 3/N-terminal domain-containing protein n=1 Tax=Pseudaeromonas paramecii TaxID=2138166 RepID=A0ABP8PWE5_9GAMM